MEIRPYPNNAKKHPKKQIEQIANSIKEFGMNQQIVVDKDGVIIVGHGRYEALKQLGWEIKDEWIKVVDLTEEQARAYRLADNKLNESDWDMGLVLDELKELDELDFDISLTGFEKDLIIEPEEKDDIVPEVPEVPKTKLGDLYELGEHRVLCGDSTKIEDVEKLMNGQKADMVFTDPPYGIGYEYNEHKDTIGEEYLSFCDEWFNTIQTLEPKYIAISTGWKYQKYWWNKDPRDVMYWLSRNKRTGGTAFHFRKIEPIFVWGNPFKKYDFDFFEQTTEVEEGLREKHTCPKPVSLIVSFIEKGADYQKLVLDIFLGSGTTLIASEKTNRKCYGMELDPKYTDVIVDRWCKFTGITDIKKNGKPYKWELQEEGW